MDADRRVGSSGVLGKGIRATERARPNADLRGNWHVCVMPGFHNHSERRTAGAFCPITRPRGSVTRLFAPGALESLEALAVSGLPVVVGP